MTSDLEVNWIPPHRSSLPNLSPLHPTQLSIPAVTVKDSGRWTCQLKKNATVLTSATVVLKVGKELRPKVCNPWLKSLLFFWIKV